MEYLGAGFSAASRVRMFRLLVASGRGSALADATEEIYDRLKLSLLPTTVGVVFRR